jgi:small-conductance mechanosensitive channel
MMESLQTLWVQVQEVLDFNLGPFTLGKLLSLMLLLTVVLIGERWIRRFLTKRVLTRTQLDPSFQYALGRFAGYCFIAIGCLIALDLVGIDLNSLAFVAGAVGIGIGFGLQNIISNFVSGLILLAERPIAIGHRVEVGGVAGLVTQISLRSTTVVTNDNITIIVPNSDFITTPVTNWSYGDPKVRLRLSVGVAYGSDVEKVHRILLEVAAGNASVLKDPAPQVFFVGFGDSSLDFELGVWTADRARNPRGLRSELNFAIDRLFRQNGVEIPFPQRDLHLRSGKLALGNSSVEARGN